MSILTTLKTSCTETVHRESFNTHIDTQTQSIASPLRDKEQLNEGVRR